MGTVFAFRVLSKFQYDSEKMSSVATRKRTATEARLQQSHNDEKYPAPATAAAAAVAAGPRPLAVAPLNATVAPPPRAASTDLLDVKSSSSNGSGTVGTGSVGASMSTTSASPGSVDEGMSSLPASASASAANPILPPKGMKTNKRLRLHENQQMMHVRRFNLLRSAKSTEEQLKILNNTSIADLPKIFKNRGSIGEKDPLKKLVEKQYQERIRVADELWFTPDCNTERSAIFPQQIISNLVILRAVEDVAFQLRSCEDWQCIRSPPSVLGAQFQQTAGELETMVNIGHENDDVPFNEAGYIGYGFGLYERLVLLCTIANDHASKSDQVASQSDNGSSSSSSSSDASNICGGSLAMVLRILCEFCMATLKQVSKRHGISLPFSVGLNAETAVSIVPDKNGLMVHGLGGSMGNLKKHVQRYCDSMFSTLQKHSEETQKGVAELRNGITARDTKIGEIEARVKSVLTREESLRVEVMQQRNEMNEYNKHLAVREESLLATIDALREKISINKAACSNGQLNSPRRPSAATAAALPQFCSPPSHHMSPHRSSQHNPADVHNPASSAASASSASSAASASQMARLNPSLLPRGFVPPRPSFTT